MGLDGVGGGVVHAAIMPASRCAFESSSVLTLPQAVVELDDQREMGTFTDAVAVQELLVMSIYLKIVAALGRFKQDHADPTEA